MKIAKKAFDVCCLVLGFVSTGVALIVVPRVYQHSGLGSAAAVAALGLLALVGGFTLLQQLRKRGYVEW